MFSDIFVSYEEQMFQHALRNMADLIYCPRDFCALPVIRDASRARLGARPCYFISPRSSSLTAHYPAICGGCNYSFCAFCHRSYHGEVSCPMRSALFDRYLKAGPEERATLEEMYGKEKFREYMNEYSSIEFIKGNSMRCPSCNTPVEKTEGCNKMHCNVCHVRVACDDVALSTPDLSTETILLPVRRQVGRRHALQAL